MSFKIYRLHSANATNTDWHETEKLSEARIQTIKDAADSHYSIPVTSIPSPFGRVFLVKNAFEKINTTANTNTRMLEGETIYHRLISETFDLAEMLFNFDNFKAAGVNIDIQVWNKTERLNGLRNSYSPQHKLLARTLDLFWADAMADTDRMYIFRKDFKVIGGTSASTLFFTTPNEGNLSHSTPIKMGNDTLFDFQFNPLYKRDKHFQIFLYTWLEAHPQLKVRMPLLSQHLNISLKAVAQADNALYQQLAAIQQMGQQAAMNKLQQDYAVANVSGPGTVIMLMPDVYMYKAKSSTISGADSDFTVGSFEDGTQVNTKTKEEKKPLILQNSFDLPLTYWGGRWESKTQVPFFDAKPIAERILPGMHVQYPYLTVSDFLEPQLMELPYTLNAERFFDGNAQGFAKGSKQDNVAPDNSFLLPINRRFFDYFDVADLQRSLFDGTKVLTITKIDSNSVKVVLRLPVKANNQYITFERVYMRGVQPNLAENKGAIVAATLNLGFFPFLRDVREKRVVVIERETELMQPYLLRFYRQNSPEYITPSQETMRSSLQKGHYATSNYLSLQDPFDYLTITKGSHNGLLVPRFPNWVEGAKHFTFAIDFGTTNSHIEYSEGNSTPIPFDITAQDVQLVMLHNSDWVVTPREIQDYFLYEMIPTNIGTEFKFPTRSALAEAENLNFSGALLTYGDFNPAMYYEKYRNIPQSVVNTNLKWASVADETTHQKRVRAYIESLLIMVRNKVLLSGGSLQNARIIWFYPASMSHFVMTGLENIWNELHRKYFPSARPLIRYSESEAPYYYRADATPSIHPSVNIDIGGGSTDVVVFQNNEARALSSFRFAGNVLFSNGYIKGASLENGFVKAFQPIVERFLTENYYKLLDLNEVFNQLKDPSRNQSSDLISFFFSLDSKSHTQLAANHLDFAFSNELRNDQNFKIMYYLFFGCQMFHIAQMMKSLEMGLPQHIFFSGNGSKTLNLLDISSDWRSLTSVSRIIFEKVYQTPFHREGVQLHRNSEPKEATCRGGIKKLSSFSNAVDKPISNIVFVGDEHKTIINETGGVFAGNRMKYSGIDEMMKKSVVDEVRRCLRILLLEVPNEFNVGNFGIPVGKMEAYYNVLDHSLEGYLQAGLEDRFQTTDKEQTIEETLFFYPLIGAIHKLGLAIGNKQV
jgi:hypothetical protein